MNHRPYSVKELQKVFKGESSIKNEEEYIHTLLIDSRKLIESENTLFFALVGRRDGHMFIEELYKAGVRNFVISNSTFNYSAYPDSNFYLVKNVLTALQDLAGEHRKQFNYPVIAITGSNGKTIVKEWLYQLLAPEYKIVRNPKSYNSQVGVPLSVWKMNKIDELAIFEAGISKVGEMKNLAKIIYPTIGILTNIGEEHDKYFTSRNEKIAEKLELFKHVDLFIYSSKYLKDYKGIIPGKKQFLWNDGKADLEIIDSNLFQGRSQLLKTKFKGKELKVIIPFRDPYSIENVIICLATLLAMGYEPDEIGPRLEKLIPINTRLELKDGINNCSLIDDSFGLDIASLAIALDFLKQQQQHERRTLILSDISELSVEESEVYEDIAILLESKSVDCLIGVGEKIQHYSYLFKLEKLFFRNTDEFLLKLPALKLSNETILIKGAPNFEFERISKALTHKVHETVLEINLGAVEHNLNYYKTLLKPGVKMMGMVKAFSYGSGSFEIANLLEFNKIDYLAVAYPDEGVSLRQAGVKLPIMVMSPDIISFDTMIEHQLEPEIYSHRILQAFIYTVNSHRVKNYPIHIKLDTGMHRLGFMEYEVDSLIEQLKNTKALQVQSVFSHLVASEDPQHDEFTRNQIYLFDLISKRLKIELGYSFIRHIANTSGIERWPDAQFDLVRLGIGLYGINKKYPLPSLLQTVMSLKTSISQIKEIPVGDTIGYGRKGVMTYGGRTATVKIGYADGYNQAWGNGVGTMLINDQEAPTIGRICMDMSMLDITGLEVNEGDEVIIFNHKIKIEALAQKLNISPYEILTGISQRVKRVYYYE